MRYLIPLALLLAVAAPALADLQLNYNSFYGRMKKLQQPEYSDITLAFALAGERSGMPCRFYSLKLISDQHDIALDIAGNGEISLPYDEALKNSNAVLQMLQADNAEPCHVQFRLRSRMRLPATLNLDLLKHYQQQFDLLLDDMAGISKYWLPEVAGVIAEFPATASPPVMAGGAAEVTLCDANRCQIQLNTAMPADTSWTFSKRPSALLPLLELSAD